MLPMYRLSGRGLRDSPTAWFTREFLCGADEYWTVDWSTASCIFAAQAEAYDVCMAAHRPEHLRGTRVIFESKTEKMIWILTGEYDAAGDGLEGRWPD